MDNTLLLSLIVIAVIGLFVFGMFYIRRQLEKEKNILKAILVPLIVGFILAVILLVISFGTI